MLGAVDIGGTKTLVAVFDKHRKIIEQVKFLTPIDYEEFKIQLANVVANLSTKDFLKVVVAAPGRIDRDKGIGIAFGNLPWKNVHLEADFEKIFLAPVLIENDAKLAGLSEALEIKDKYKEVLYLTISTGIGYSLIRDGKIDISNSDSGGKVMMLEHKGKLTPWEDFASGKAIRNHYNKQASDITDPDAWKKISRNLAVGLIELIAITTPDVVVIGGGAGSNFSKFGKTLSKQLKQYETPMLTIPPLLPAKHPEEAVIYGCYDYAKNYHE